MRVKRGLENGKIIWVIFDFQLLLFFALFDRQIICVQFLRLDRHTYELDMKARCTIFDSTVHSIFSACPTSEATTWTYRKKKPRYKQKGKRSFLSPVFLLFVFILRPIITLSSRRPYTTNVHPTLYIVYQPVWRQYLGNYYYCNTFRELCM